MIVADTDVLIDFLRGSSVADRIELELRTGRLATTAITVFELGVGATSRRRSAAVDGLLAALHVLPLTVDAAREGAAIARSLTAAGQSIGTADSLIAGICLVQKAILITKNLKHFCRVPNLSVATLTL